MDSAGEKSDARAKRFASPSNGKVCFRAALMAASRWCAVQRLFFGDFLLAPQKKFTRLPGRTPGNLSISSFLRKSPLNPQRLQAAEGFAFGPVLVCGMKGIVPSALYENSSIATERRYSPPPGSSAL
jgi:hypothetical protein